MSHSLLEIVDVLSCSFAVDLLNGSYCSLNVLRTFWIYSQKTCDRI